MALFKSKVDVEDATSTQKTLAKSVESLNEKVQVLTGEIAGLTKTRERLREHDALVQEIDRLQRQKTEAEIARSLRDEEFGRKQRETEHKVGLLRTQQEHDLAHSTRMAVLDVKEGNLAADQKRFKDEMDFQRKALADQIKQSQDMLSQVLQRLPNIDVALSGNVGTPTPAPEPRSRKA